MAIINDPRRTVQLHGQRDEHVTGPQEPGSRKLKASLLQ
jgi:hypothetical protein